MQFIIKLTLSLFTVLYLSSCVNPPEYPVVPVIKFERLNKSSIFQGIPSNPLDTLLVTFSFTDGDGDLSEVDGPPNIEFIDSRNPGVIAQVNSLPIIPEEGTGNGIRGEVYIEIVNRQNANFNICCFNLETQEACQPFPDMPIDTFSYAITMTDRAGNVSNSIRTEVISIICQQ